MQTQNQIIDLRDAPSPAMPGAGGKAPAGQRPAGIARSTSRNLGSGTEERESAKASAMLSTAGNISGGMHGRGIRKIGIAHSTESHIGSGAIEWTALEYPRRERGPYWWLPPSAGALACVLFAILVRSYLFAGFAAIALLAALLYARREPRPYRFAISPEGVYIGEKRHRFAELKSFWIFEHEGAPELSLETVTGKISPYLFIPLGDIHPNRIRRVLSDFLPEKEHAELFTDQIARSIGF